MIEDRWRRRAKWFLWLYMHDDMNWSIRQIARKAKVAPSTVSRGVSGARRIEAQNKEWVGRARWLLGVDPIRALEYIETKLRPMKPPRKRYDLCQ